MAIVLNVHVLLGLIYWHGPFDFKLWGGAGKTF